MTIRLAPRRICLICASVLLLTLGGCGRKAKIVLAEPTINVLDVDYEIKQLDSKIPQERLVAMTWLKSCDKGEAQRALPKLKEIAAKDKNAGARKVAADTIKVIEGG